MKVSDYIVEYLIDCGVTDVFGYPGGMVTHLMDSFSRYSDQIRSHVTYHEQGAAFAACGYAQATGRTGVAYATSGPGATNLITGICNAFFDSVPVIFITGNVNTYEKKGNLKIRQRGFQETDIVSMVSTVTKYAASVDEANRIKWYLDQAFYVVNDGRKGPVLLDIPMDIFRADIDPDTIEGFKPGHVPNEILESDISDLKLAESVMSDHLDAARRPLLLIGNGLNRYDGEVRKMLGSLSIPIISTMPAFDVNLHVRSGLGFIGAYGGRAANLAVSKCDLLISVGARLDIRQVGRDRERFADQAHILRIDIDCGELAYHLHDDETDICMDARDALSILCRHMGDIVCDYSDWVGVCDELRQKLLNVDDRTPNRMIGYLSRKIPDGAVVTTDVGQNQVWVAQSFEVKNGQRFLFSGGHGAMGYSLPAAIGAALGTGSQVYSFNGDGGIQMNIQELQTIAREHLPVKVIVVNNHALGMIRHFQEMYFNSNYTQTTADQGYTVPDFAAIAEAYGLAYGRIDAAAEPWDIPSDILTNDDPAVIELDIIEDTYVFPKLEYGKPYYMQEPQLDGALFEHLRSL